MHLHPAEVHLEIVNYSWSLSERLNIIVAASDTESDAESNYKHRYQLLQLHPSNIKLLLLNIDNDWSVYESLIKLLLLIEFLLQRCNPLQTQVKTGTVASVYHLFWLIFDFAWYVKTLFEYQILSIWYSVWCRDWICSKHKQKWKQLHLSIIFFNFNNWLFLNCNVWKIQIRLLFLIQCLI